MIRLLVIAGLISALIGYHVWAVKANYKAGEKSSDLFWHERLAEDRKVAEKRLQEATEALTGTYQRQYDEIHAINTNLLADNNRLLKRSERMSEASRAACQGASGQELSRRDAAFLTGLAASCQRQQVNLKAHQEYVDQIQSLYQ